MEQQGNRKVILTKWMLVIFAVGTLAYLTVLLYQGTLPPETFYIIFVGGLGCIGGSFTIGNVFEHLSKSKTNIIKEDE